MNRSKPTLLQLLPFPFPEAQERLKQHFDVIELWTEPDPDGVIAARANDIVALVTHALMNTRADLIDRLPRLQVICSNGVGYDGIDVKHAQAKGIQVSNTPEVLNDCVADHAMGLLLATARRLGHAERYVRAGLWGGNTPFPLGVKVSHKKMGIVGLGRIGLAIAQRARGFDMEVRYHNRHERNDVDMGYEASLTALAEWADFLVVATVGGATTRHLINENVLNALGPDGTLINIARGSVVDEAAMVRALVEGRLGGAGLDVYDAEPSVPDALKSLDNVVIVPHIASATTETRRAMADLVVTNAESFIKTGKLLTPIAAL
ncbi:MAG TPA: 2-hydroxyacid dehydrogenase [Candidimonas sp.]|nr:2-hydroxyacid dehydrogenase [Candidimonas sp.]